MWDWISKTAELLKSSKPFAVLTVIKCEGSTPREVGAKMLVLSENEFYGTIGGGHLELRAIRDAFTAIKDKKNQSVRYALGANLGQCCGGTVEVFMEVMNTNPVLYLFGAGHVGTALTQVLDGTPFQVTLIDDREEWLYSNAVPKSVTCRLGEWNEFENEMVWDEARTFAIVMTHQHDIDEQIVFDLMSKPFLYCGLIGSNSKWAAFQKRLIAKGIADNQLAKVHCPIGLDVGGKAPKEVAISIAAELLKTYYGK